MMAWQEFEDTSHVALVMLCEWSPEFADDLAFKAKLQLLETTNDLSKASWLWRLGRALEKTPSTTLRGAVEQHIGLDWTELYLAALPHFLPFE